MRRGGLAATTPSRKRVWRSVGRRARLFDREPRHNSPVMSGNSGISVSSKLCPWDSMADECGSCVTADRATSVNFDRWGIRGIPDFSRLFPTFPSLAGRAETGPQPMRIPKRPPGETPLPSLRPILRRRKTTPPRRRTWRTPRRGAAPRATPPSGSPRSRRTGGRASRPSRKAPPPRAAPAVAPASRKLTQLRRVPDESESRVQSAERGSSLPSRWHFRSGAPAPGSVGPVAVAPATRASASGEKTNTIQANSGAGKEI